MQETTRLRANPSAAFGRVVGLQGTSAVQRSLAESKRRQLLCPCTISCRTANIVTIAFEADLLPFARRPHIALSLRSSRHLGRTRRPVDFASPFNVEVWDIISDRNDQLRSQDQGRK